MAKKKKPRTTTGESLHHLPEEIIKEILMRLAVRPLLRFRCVSKSWLSLIDSKRFIETQNTDYAPHRVLISTLIQPNEPKQCSLFALLEGTDLSPLGHPASPNPLGASSCCNSFVCVYERKPLLLLNPFTGVSKELPKDPEIDNRNRSLYLLRIGLGWDETVGAYKVFAGWKVIYMVPPFTRLYSRVYSCKTNSWKTVEDPYLRTPCRQVGVFAGGKLHWLSTQMKTISSLDVKSEVFGKIELPDQTDKDRCYLMLGTFGGRLCVTYDFYRDPKKITFDVWVMKESWEKLLTIHLLHEPRHNVDARSAQVIGEAANGEILIAFRTSLLVYCPRDDVIRHRREIGRYFKVHLCVESLVSPFDI